MSDLEFGFRFPAGGRVTLFLQIVHNFLVSTWSPVQGVPRDDSRWEKRQVHDANHLHPCLHDLHENNFRFTCIEQACSLLYCKYHVHFINQQSVYYTLMNMFITRNMCMQVSVFFLLMFV